MKLCLTSWAVASVLLSLAVGCGMPGELPEQSAAQNTVAQVSTRDEAAAATSVTPSVGIGSRAQPEPPVVLNTTWEMELGPDYTTTVDPTERDAHGAYVGTYYIPSTNLNTANAAISGVQPLYRLLSPGKTDHMDSLLYGEGGYEVEGGLGFVWSSATTVPGLSGLDRLYDNQTGNYHSNDHALRERSMVPVSHTEPIFAYYEDEGSLGYGYARYAGTDQALSAVVGGGVTVQSNLATGGAVWEWTFDGVQFVNDYDYGRQIQVTMTPAVVLDGGGPQPALGEAGDAYGGPSIDVDARHPSPCLLAETAGSTQKTAAIPLAWLPDLMNGGVNNPVIFPHVTLGKTLMLNWPGPDNQPLDWPVALYQTTIGTPVTIPVTAVEAPSAYLNEQFNSYGIYDLATKTLTSISATTVRAHNPYNATGGGAQAIVLSDPATGLAMGAYINSPNAGFVFYDNTGGNSPGQTGSSFAKWSVQYYSGVTAGGWTFNTWIVTDKLANVLKDFDQLYAWGVNSR